jgi:putative glutamine amidotransferase
MNRPIVIVTTRRTPRGIRHVDYVGELHLELLLQLRILPMIVPVVSGVLACLPQYLREMDGLLLFEGEDIEPRRFAAEKGNFRYLEKTHPLKDEVELRLLRHALRRELPVLGICRGSQLVNVACGGALFGDVKKEKRSRLQHIDRRHYDAYRHSVAVVPGTPLARWYGRGPLRVNSYHHQGIRRLARRLVPMARAQDGLIEAYFDPRADFLVGLQFHPERMLPEYRGNMRVWEAFASAVRRRKRARTLRENHSHGSEVLVLAGGKKH